MPGAVISTPNLLFYFPGESIASLTGRWTDWVARDATVTTPIDTTAYATAAAGFNGAPASRVAYSRSAHPSAVS